MVVECIRYTTTQQQMTMWTDNPYHLLDDVLRHHLGRSPVHWSRLTQFIAIVGHHPIE